MGDTWCACRLEEFIPFDCYQALRAVEKELTRAMKNEELRMHMMKYNKVGTGIRQSAAQDILSPVLCMMQSLLMGTCSW